MTCTRVPQSLLFALLGSAAFLLSTAACRPASATDHGPDSIPVIEAPDALPEADAASAVLRPADLCGDEFAAQTMYAGTDAVEDAFRHADEYMDEQRYGYVDHTYDGHDWETEVAEDDQEYSEWEYDCVDEYADDDSPHDTGCGYDHGEDYYDGGKYGDDEEYWYDDEAELSESDNASINATEDISPFEESCYDWSYDDKHDPVWEDGDESDEISAADQQQDDFSYRDVDPFEYDMYYHADETPAEGSTDHAIEPSGGGIKLFVWYGVELLADSDQQILIGLERLCEQSSGARRAVLNEYLDALGAKAIDFAIRFEDLTGIEVLSFADDLPAAATFLISFRLLQQHQLEIDESVDLLERSMENPSLDWIEEVGRITQDAFLEADETASVSEYPVVGAMLRAATRSVKELRVVGVVLSSRLAELPWESITKRLGEVPSAILPVGSDQPVQR